MFIQTSLGNVMFPVHEGGISSVKKLFLKLSWQVASEGVDKSTKKKYVELTLSTTMCSPVLVFMESENCKDSCARITLRTYNPAIVVEELANWAQRNKMESKKWEELEDHVIKFPFIPVAILFTRPARVTPTTPVIGRG